MNSEITGKSIKPYKGIEPGKFQKGGSLPKPDTPRPKPPQGHKPKNDKQ